MNKIAAITNLNEAELQQRLSGTTASWHQPYIHCDAVYIGGLPDSFSEHSLLAVLEQYGTVLHVNLVRDNHTNASRGFAFAKFADPRSCVLAIDNLNGFHIDGRHLRVDHADHYVIRDHTGVDTTPAGFLVNAQPLTNGNRSEQTPPLHPVNDVAEKRREAAVLQRLDQIRKGTTDRQTFVDHQNSPSRRNSHPHSTRFERRSREHQSHDQITALDPSAPSTSRVDHIEKERHKEERKRRKEERARIRKERVSRRASREGRSN